MYRFLIKEDLSGYDLSALKWANCAGEPLNPEVYDQFLRLTGVKIHEGRPVLPVLGSIHLLVISSGVVSLWPKPS